MNSNTTIYARAAKRDGARGFTLIEMTITIVIAGIVLLSMFVGFHEALKHLTLQRDLRQAVALTDDLMREVCSAQFYRMIESPTINKRADCTCVDDYSLWSESPPQTKEGVPMTNYAGFTRKVFVERINPTNHPTYYNFNMSSTTNDTLFRRIRVVVSNRLVSVTNVSVVTGN